jgi:hypothetical protein
MERRRIRREGFAHHARPRPHRDRKAAGAVSRAVDAAAGRGAAARKGRGGGGTAARGRRGRGMVARWRASPALGRWGWAVGLALSVLVLLPVVHALFGDLGVLILGSLGLGFLLGRWTGRRG